MKSLIFKSFIFLIILFVFGACCGFFGDNDLGDNFSVLEGDRIEDRAIVYCTEKSGRCCYSGIPVLPSRTDSLTSYVINANSDKGWIVAKTKRKNGAYDFWIINKDFKTEFKYDDGGKLYETIQTHVVGPLSELEFTRQVEERHISINFKK